MTSPWLMAGVVFLSRALLIVAFGAFTHGSEISDDASMHLRMLSDPWQILAGNTLFDGQHPPLLPALMAVVAKPLLWSGVPKFFALRLTFAAYEAALAGVVWNVLKELQPSTKQRAIRAVALVFLPMGWMTSVVMSQDEAIAGLFFVLILWRVRELDRVQALMLASIGVLAGKVLLLLPLTALLVAWPRAGRARALVLAVGPLLLTYGWICVFAWLKNQPLPFVGFRPSATYGTTLWTLLLPYLGIEAVRLSATVITALACAMVLVLCRRAMASAAGLIATMIALMLTTFALHYHINPEYYLIVIPGMLLLREPTALTLAVFLSAVPWSVNFFSGVANARALGSQAGAKAQFVRLYELLFAGMSISTLHSIAIIATSALTLCAAGVAIRQARAASLRA